MNEIRKQFVNKQPFVGFVVAGDGGIDYCLECCLQLIEGGVDILEIGFPFSDPIADGPMIQRAAERSLKEGTNSETILELGRRIREKSDVPLILFTYFNPLLKRGDSYLDALKTAGFNAVLVVDLPPPLDEKTPYYRKLKEAKLLPVFVVCPSTDDKRIDQITKLSEGFIYYACQKGTTGLKDKLPNDVPFHISRIRQTTEVPIAIGFGISNRSSAKSALSQGDGFVIGSAFVQLMERKANPHELKQFAQEIDPRFRCDIS